MTKGRRPIRRILVFSALLMLPLAATAETNWQLVGPEGGEVGFFLDPTAPATVYTVSSAGGFKSVDGGVSWAPAWSGIGIGHLVAFAVVPTSAAPSLLIADADTVTGALTGRLLRSADGGATWAPADNGLHNPLVAQLAVGAGPSPAVYAGAIQVFSPHLQLRFLRSRDGGASWEEPNFELFKDNPTLSPSSIAADPAVPGRVYIGGHGIWRTSDGGASWAPVGNLSLADDESVRRFAFAPAASPGLPAVIFATTWRNGPSNVYRSSDGGASWQVIGFPPPIDQVVADPSSPGTLYAIGSDSPFKIGGRLYKSGDSGASWAEVDSGIPGPSVVSLMVLPGNPSTLLASYSASDTSPGGVVRSTDGAASWQSSQSGLRATPIGQVAADPLRPGTLYGMGDAGLYKTRDGGATWRFQKSGTFGTLLLDPTRLKTLYASLDGHLSRSDDGGFTWVPIDQGLPRSSSAIYTLDATGKTLWAYSGRGLYKSTDAGATWTLVRRISVTAARFLAVDLAGNVYLVAQDNSANPPSAVILRSTDGGATFTPGGQGIPAGAYVSELSVDPAGSALYLASSQGVLRSTDQGATWALSPLPPTAFDPSRPTWASTVLADPRSPGTVYAGTYFGGVDWSSDGGTTWAPLGGPADFAVYSLALDPFSPATVYAAGGAGLLRHHP